MKTAINKLKAELEIVEADLTNKQKKLAAAKQVYQGMQNEVLEAQIKHKGLVDAISTLEGE